MVGNRWVVAGSVIGLVAGAVGPLAVVGCSANGGAPVSSAANGAPSASYNQAPAAPPPGYPPPGYPQQPAPQPAYAQASGAPAQPPPAGYPPAQPAPPPITQPSAAAPAPSASQVLPPPFGPTDPATLQAILQGIQTALGGQMVPPAAVTTDLTEAGLKAFALKAAPGMQPEGDELKQTLAEGQHAVTMVTLQAGKCYAIVGFSAPGGVKELNLNLLPPPYLTLAGQDLTHHNMPSIGGAPSPMCPVIPFPIQYKLDVFAKAGSGPVAVQLYSKAK
jgi:hypothetical protein